MNNSKALVNFYARLVLKDQIKLEDIDVTYQDDVRKVLAEMEIKKDE